MDKKFECDGLKLSKKFMKSLKSCNIKTENNVILNLFFLLNMEQL